MKTLILQEPGRLQLISTPAPEAPKGDEALVRVHRVGVCGTDLHAFRGRQPFFTYPRILGHELGVEIVAIGPNDKDLKVGDKCAVEPYLNCGRCIACRRGKPNCCADLKVMGVHIDGGMREWIHVPIRKLHRATTLSYEQIALVETLAIGCHAVARAETGPDDTTLVIGAGPIGLAAIQFAQAAGSRVMVMDISEQRLDFCRTQLGVKYCIQAGHEPVQMIGKLTDGDMATVVMDATGNPKSMCGALSFMAHGGKLVYVGLFVGDFSLNDPDFHRHETTLLSSRNALPDDFPKIIGAIESGRINTRPWITHRCNVEQVVAEFHRFTQPETGVVKAVIEF
ncbi:MAG: zinc-binding alcohol dehydrogenase family protein [Phycisphaerae bacterium]